jgi:predicted phage tail protein
MDWPGAQEMAARFAKTIDPKLLSNEDDPALQAANQQMQAMGKEMDQMHQMLQNVSKSMEAQDLQIKQFDSSVKAYDAETKRISAVQNSMGEDQIHDIVMGTLHAALATGDIVSGNPMLGNRDNIPENEPQETQNAPMQSDTRYDSTTAPV